MPSGQCSNCFSFKEKYLTLPVTTSREGRATVGLMHTVPHNTIAKCRLIKGQIWRDFRVRSWSVFGELLHNVLYVERRPTDSQWCTNSQQKLLGFQCCIEQQRVFTVNELNTLSASWNMLFPPSKKKKGKKSGSNFHFYRLTNVSLLAKDMKKPSIILMWILIKFNVV